MAQRGGKRPGAGRPKGATTRKTRELAEQAAKEGLTPLEYMLALLRDPQTSDELKRWAAEKAAPYVHPRLAAVDANVSGDINHSHERAIETLE